jgi:hypothetical protein
MSGWDILGIYAILATASLLVIMWMYHKAEEGYQHNGRYYKGKPPDNMGKIPRCPREHDHKKEYELNEISPQVYECGCGTIFWFKDCAHWEILTHDDVQKMANICADWQIRQKSQQA